MSSSPTTFGAAVVRSSYGTPDRRTTSKDSRKRLTRQPYATVVPEARLHVQSDHVHDSRGQERLQSLGVRTGRVELDVISQCAYPTEKIGEIGVRQRFAAGNAHRIQHPLSPPEKGESLLNRHEVLGNRPGPQPVIVAVRAREGTAVGKKRRGETSGNVDENSSSRVLRG